MKKLFFFAALFLVTGFIEAKAATIVTLCRNNNCWQVVYQDLDDCAAARERVAGLDAATGRSTTVANCELGFQVGGSPTRFNDVEVTPMVDLDIRTLDGLLGKGVPGKKYTWIMLRGLDRSYRVYAGNANLDQASAIRWAAEKGMQLAFLASDAALSVNKMKINPVKGVITQGKYGEILIDTVPIGLE